MVGEVGVARLQGRQHRSHARQRLVFQGDQPVVPAENAPRYQPVVR